MQKFLGLRGPNYIRKRQQRLTAQGKLFQLGWEGSRSQEKDSGKSFSAGAGPSENRSKNHFMGTLSFLVAFISLLFIYSDGGLSPSFQAISNKK